MIIAPPPRSPHVRSPRAFFPACLLAFAVAAAPAWAQSLEVGAGTSVTRRTAKTPVVSVAWLPEWRPFRSGLLHWEVGALYLRGRRDSRLANGDDVTVFHGGLRYERADNGFTAGFGVGVQDGETEALSGSPQFVSTVGWRWGRFSLLARHVSNASLHQPNDGETMLQGAWRF